MIRAAAVAVVCLIALLSLVPGDVQVRTGAPKELEHLVAYTTAGALIAVALDGRWHWAIGTAFLVVLAGSLELLQDFAPGRSPNLMDWKASSFGSIAGVVLSSLWSRAIRGAGTCRQRERSRTDDCAPS